MTEGKKTLTPLWPICDSGEISSPIKRPNQINVENTSHDETDLTPAIKAVCVIKLKSAPRVSAF